mmetsp:Transcript_26432/g.53694  ORF Transcript_26432/g.53694 Transcript_26432/m.53694 type:complete len:224 (+) Transcript_26432:224-895(+)
MSCAFSSKYHSPSLSSNKFHPKQKCLSDPNRTQQVTSSCLALAKLVTKGVDSRPLLDTCSTLLRGPVLIVLTDVLILLDEVSRLLPCLLGFLGFFLPLLLHQLPRPLLLRHSACGTSTTGSGTGRGHGRVRSADNDALRTLLLFTADGIGTKGALSARRTRSGGGSVRIDHGNSIGQLDQRCLHVIDVDFLIHCNSQILRAIVFILDFGEANRLHIFHGRWTR